MRTLLLTLIILSNLLIYFQFTASAVSNFVTVKMTSLGKSINSLSITVNGSYKISDNNENLQTGSTYTIAVAGSGLTISNGSVSYSFGASFLLSKKDTSLLGIKIHNPLLNKDFNYLGNMSFTNESGNLIVYNYIDIETYVCGVVSQEMGNGFPLEALKAQAIAARTVAYYKRLYVTDDTTTQAYIGYNENYTNVINAVNATKSMVLTYGSDLVDTYYSASNGGYTERTDYYWTKGYPYYQVNRDEYDYKNTRNVYVHTFKFPKNISSATPLDSKLSTLFATPVRDKLNSLGYNSTASYSINQFTNIVTNTPPNSRYPADSPVHTKATIAMNLSVTNNSGGTDNISAAVDIKLSDLCRAYNISYNYRIYEEGSETDYLTITGHGTPHGIGLSQYGAQQRASEGQTYSQILSFYYVNTTIGKIELVSNTNIWYGITITKVNLRSGPSTSYSIIQSMDVSTNLQILQANIDGGPWFKVRLDSTQEGYVHGDYIMIGDMPITINSITVVSPTKTIYFEGQDLDLTGAKITVNYNNGTSEEITATADMITGFNKNTLGQQTLTVTYKENTATFNVTVIKKGDINGDGNVTAVDALQALQAASGRITLTDAQKEAADVTGDGKVTAVDALRILQFASGRITSFD